MARFNHLSLLLLRVFVLMLPCFAKFTTDVSYCDQKTDYDVKVKGVEISPTPVTRGKPATFSISATTSDTISGGKLVIEVSYFGWHVHSETHDLCAETSCPVAQGDFVVSHSQVLPGYTPPLDTGSCWFHINIAQGRVPGDGIFIENFSQLPPNRGFSLLRVHIPLR